MIGQYICGCSILEKRRYTTDIDTQGNISFSRTDNEGFDICPEHGKRRYGWRSEIELGRPLVRPS